MRNSTGRPRRALLAAFLITAGLGLAGETRTWVQSDYDDFEQGVIKGLSLRSDGLLTLAPRFSEVFDSSAAYLWALARDSKGNLYTGGGPGAKLFRITPKGEKKAIAELEGLALQAIAVDAKDRVYAATSPDGKIFRIAGGGKPEVFYDPKAKYIWALAFNAQGDLFVGTGDQGQIHRVSPDGKGSVFFRSDETHVRSLVVDAKGNLIAGTDPGGLVLRVSPAGEGFVLYQARKKEVTAVLVGRDGAVYAGAVGNKQPAPSVPPPPPAPAPAPLPTAAAGAGQVQLRPAAPPPASVAPAGAPGISGGSELYRIDAGGNPRRIWSHPQDIVYALGLDAQGRVLVGTGNKGYIYRIDSESLYTALLNATSTQITAFAAAPDNRLYAATGNVGKIYEIGPGLEREGTIESDVFDAGLFSHWGRLSFEGAAEGGRIGFVTRSGNLDQPQKNWSLWAAPQPAGAKAGRIASPPARFVQWKATLTAGGADRSPTLDSVEIGYLLRNVEPQVSEIEITPANYKFPPPPVINPPQNLNLPPMGKRPPTRTTPPAPEVTTTPPMQYDKGWLGARWTASDENGDTLIYRVEIRGAGETAWKLLKDKVREKYLSWDGTAYPDGEYRLRVTASDQPSNPPQEALSSSTESETFLIDNTPPRISGLAAARSGAGLTVRWKAADALSMIQKAEYSLDGGEWTVVLPAGRLSDAPELDYELTLPNVPAGEHTVAVRVADDFDNLAAEKVVVRQ